ncbi:MAG: hypothetical protein KGK10_08405 [Rhodospirillales bacterium]|nr:hypothetical protein [Rhodospirillales bacterium]
MPPPSPLNAATLAALRAALPPLARHGRLPLGPAALDVALGGGLALGALHAIAEAELTAGAAGVSAGFVASILGRMEGPVLWIAPRADLFPAGLIRFGLDPARLLLAAPADERASLAAMEAGLRAGVTTVGEIGMDGMATRGRRGSTGHLEGRRLAMACLDQGATGFLLLRRTWAGREGAGREDCAAAFTRWRIAPAPSRGQGSEPGKPRWILRLLAARGGAEGEWLVEPGGEDDEAPALRLAAGLGTDASGAGARATG